MQQAIGATEAFDPSRTAARAAGDVSAASLSVAEFEDIVAELQTPLVNYLRRMTRCEERARDIAQEAFVRLYSARHRYREQGLLAAYVYRIATNLLRSEERRRGRWRLLEPRFRSSEPTVEEESTARAAERSESSREVRLAIAQLPTKFRAPLVLRELEGRSYAEIAQLLGCREGTVKSRVNRAKERLREQLSSYWLGS